MTVGLLSRSALIVHVSDGKPESYFHFFVMVAALSLYEDWVPFGAAVAFVLVQQGDHGRDRRLRPRRVALAVGARCTRRSSAR